LFFSSSFFLLSTLSCFLLSFGSDFDLTKWLIENGGYGNYTAKWSSSKGKGEVTKFEIVPSSERLEKQ